MLYTNIKETRKNGTVTLTADCRLGADEIIFQGTEEELCLFNEANAIVFTGVYIQNVALAEEIYCKKYF